MSWRGVQGRNGNVPAIAPDRIVADPRKFTEYALDPDHPKGESRIFIGRLGYRPRSEEDAQTLAETYVSQARVRIAAGDHALGERDRFGQRLAIAIVVRDTTIVSGWILLSDGTL